jgi:hypothetical protein
MSSGGVLVFDDLKKFIGVDGGRGVEVMGRRKVPGIESG